MQVACEIGDYFVDPGTVGWEAKAVDPSSPSSWSGSRSVSFRTGILFAFIVFAGCVFDSPRISIAGIFMGCIYFM